MQGREGKTEILINNVRKCLGSGPIRRAKAWVLST
jgi:hypothetical protein